MIYLHCLHSSKRRSGHLFFPDLKSLLFSSRCYYQNFEFNVINTGKKIIKKIFWWCLNRYYLMILIQYYFLVSFCTIKNKNDLLNSVQKYDSAFDEIGLKLTSVKILFYSKVSWYENVFVPFVILIFKSFHSKVTKEGAMV